MNIIMMGAGVLGESLAKTLERDGHKLVIIERNHDKAEKIACLTKAKVLCCDGTKIESVASAVRHSRADAFIAITGNDADNLIACQIAKNQFKIKQTLCKSNKSENVLLMKQLGVDIVLDESDALSRLVSDELDEENVKFVTKLGMSDMTIKKYTVRDGWQLSGVMVRDLELPKSCLLVYVNRGEEFYIPKGETLIIEGDEVYAMGDAAASRKLKKLFC